MYVGEKTKTQRGLGARTHDQDILFHISNKECEITSQRGNSLFLSLSQFRPFVESLHFKSDGFIYDGIYSTHLTH